MTGLACGHRFCISCWCEYLTTKILEEGLGQSIACAAHDCDILVDDVTVMTLVTDQRVKSRYQKTVTNSFVEVFFFGSMCVFYHIKKKKWVYSAIAYYVGALLLTAIMLSRFNMWIHDL